MDVFTFFIKLLFTCIVHEKAIVYVMVASIYEPKYWDREQEYIWLKKAPLLHKSSISFFRVTGTDIDL